MPTRRVFIAQSLSILAVPAIAQTSQTPATASNAPNRVIRNISGFRTHNWRDHFPTLDKVSILCDTSSRSLHYWNPNGDFRLYATSVPQTDQLTRRGYTFVVRKRVAPDWTPTADMRERDPSLPAHMPPGPDNPLGTHAIYLGWTSYLIHGTHDTRKIGRRSSSGCIGLYNEKIAELFEITPVGAQVRII
ncbi:MAG: L,D-transpeptidase family protein [Rhodobacteraceae bacterium]|nr:L,D-transpeptidase family protein [Paracoccaceae bacterium]